MATLDHTPRGRGYGTALSYFHHLNDEWSQTVWQQSCRVGNASVSVVDLWRAEEGKTEGPAVGYNSTCTGDQPSGGVNATRCQPGPHGDKEWGGNEDALLAREAVSLIETHDVSTPLFLFFSPHAVHTPLQMPQEYLDRFHFMNTTDKPQHYRQLYSAQVKFVDDAIGNLTNAFKRRGMW